MTAKLPAPQAKYVEYVDAQTKTMVSFMANHFTPLEDNSVNSFREFADLVIGNAYLQGQVDQLAKFKGDLS